MSRLKSSGARVVRAILFALSVATLAWFAWTVYATTRTWDGGSAVNSNWLTPENWNPNATPTPGDDLVFATVVRSPSSNNFTSGTTFNTLTVRNAHRIIGNGLALNAGLTAGNATIDVASIRLNNSQVFTAETAGLSANISSTIDFTPAVNSLIIQGPGNFNFTGSMNAGGFVQNGTGTTTLTGPAATLSTTYVWDGTLQLGKTGGSLGVGQVLAIGDGIGASNSATARMLASNQTQHNIYIAGSDGRYDLNNFSNSTTELTVIGGSVTIGTGTLTSAVTAMTGGTISSTGAGKLLLQGNVTTNASATSTATLSGNVDLGGATRTFTVNDGAVSTDLSAGGVVSNGGLTKTGAGLLAFSGNNTYTGTTTISAGVLDIRGDQPQSSVTVNGGTLAGYGTVGPVNATSGLVKPSLSGAIGRILTVQGNLSLSSATTYLPVISFCPLGSTPNAIVIVVGTVNLSSSNFDLDVTCTPNFLPGQTYVVLSNDGTDAVSGHFAGLPEGSTFTRHGTTLYISYRGGDGNDVVLHVPTTRTWDGGGADANWMTAANWQDDFAPGTGDTLIFPSSQKPTSNNNSPAGTLFNSIFLSGTHTMQGNGITLRSNLSGQSGTISLSSITLSTFSSTQNFSATQAGSLLTITSPINTNGNTLFFTGAGDFNVSGAITGSGGSIEKNGTGSVELSGTSANTYTGQTFVSEGVLRLNKTAGIAAVSNALSVGDTLGDANSAVVRLLQSNQIPQDVVVYSDGLFDLNNFSESLSSLWVHTGSVTIGTGTLTTALQMTGGTVSSTGAGKLQLSSNVVLTQASASFATINGNLDLGGATRTFNIGDGAATVDLEVMAVISNGGLTKTGAGYLRLSGNNTYSGATTVSAGTLQINGEQPQTAVTVQGGRLEGRGTVGPVNATSGFVAPSLGGPTGILNVHGNLSFSSATTYVATIPLPTVPIILTAGIIDVAGTVNLGGSNFRLETADGTNFVPGRTYVVLRNDGTDAITGTFNNLPEGSTVTAHGQTLYITYKGGDGNDVVLYLPTTRAWEGDGADGNWTTPQNWVGDIAPGTGDTLVFPESALRKTNTNNFPSGTVFNSISLEGSGYTIGGNAVTLNSGLTDATTNFTTLDMSIGGSGGFTKSGAGVMILNANNSYTGTTTIAAGKLFVSAAAGIPNSAVQIPGGELNGTGAVGPVTATSGAIFSVGYVDPLNIDPLNVNGNLTLGPPFIFLHALATAPNGLVSGRLDVAGTVNLGGSTLNGQFINAGSPGGVYSAPTTVVLISNDGSDPVQGTFKDLPEGSIYQHGSLALFRVSYSGGDGNDVTLTSVSGTLAFTASNYTVNEGAGTASITLSRTKGSRTTAVAKVTLADITTNPADYSFAPGSLDATFNPGTGASNGIATIILQPDGKAIIGGAFTSYNNTPRGRIARINADGSLDGTFLSTGEGGDNHILTGARQPDGKVIIGGRFTTYNGTARGRIARINADGSLDATFLSTGDGADNFLTDIFVQPDGKIIVAGIFTTINGSSRNGLARLNEDGSLDTSFNPALLSDSRAQAIDLQPDGKILICGTLSVPNIGDRTLVRLNADGSFDATFTPIVLTTNSFINDVALQPDGRIIIGGSFTILNGTSRNRVARLNSNGSIDNSFAPGAGPDTSVFNALSQPDGKIIIGGAFTTYNGVTRNRVARLNADGSLDTAFDPAAGADGSQVFPLVLQPNGKLLIGGSFTNYDGTPRNNIARVNGDLFATWGPNDFANKTIQLPILDDALIEGDETLNLTLTPLSGALAGTPSTATLTITDNDATTSLSVNDVSVTEGNAGTTHAVFAVTLSAASGQTITVNYATADGTATAGSDYTATSGTLTFNPGETRKEITVFIPADTANEPDETFLVNLSAPSNTTIADDQGVGTITNDDANASAPFIFVAEGTVNQAAALDSVTFVRGPFRILNDRNFSADGHTRLIIFTSNLGLSQPDASILTVQAAGFPLTVENVGTASGVTGLEASFIVVRLPDGLPSGDLPVTLILRGITSSNAPTITIF